MGQLCVCLLSSLSVRGHCLSYATQILAENYMEFVSITEMYYTIGFMNCTIQALDHTVEVVPAENRVQKFWGGGTDLRGSKTRNVDVLSICGTSILKCGIVRCAHEERRTGAPQLLSCTSHHQHIMWASIVRFHSFVTC